MTDPQIAAAQTAYKRAEKALEARREELFKAIGEAIAEGRVRQTDVVRQTGFTREHVRRISEAYGKWASGEAPELKIVRWKPSA